MRKRMKKRGSARNIFFIVLIVFLSFILVCEITYIISELNDSVTRYHADEDDYLRQITYENYYRIFDEAVEDCELDREFTATETEIRAVGYYYEAASLWQAYQALGDEASAAKQKERMERFREQAGKYAGDTEKIDELLIAARTG